MRRMTVPTKTCWTLLLLLAAMPAVAQQPAAARAGVHLAATTEDSAQMPSRVLSSSSDFTTVRS